jgi:hypothetical protein
MRKGVIYIILAVVCVIAALVMKQAGETSGHLSELKDYYYVPLPLACVLIAVGIQQLKKKE